MSPLVVLFRVISLVVSLTTAKNGLPSNEPRYQARGSRVWCRAHVRLYRLLFYRLLFLRNRSCTTSHASMQADDTQSRCQA